MLCRRDSRLCSPRSRAFGRRQVQGAKARAARRTQPEIYGTTGASVSFCAASPSCPPPPFPRCSVRRLPPRSTTTSRCYPRSPRRFCSLLPPLRGRARAPGAPSSPPPGPASGAYYQRRTRLTQAPSCHVWRMGDISCSGPREGQELVVLELARAARATQVLANERQESDETDVADDLSSSASRDHPLARAGAATEWLDDVGVLASTRCQGAAAEDTREREESSGTATPSTCCSVAGTSRAQLHTPLGEGTTPTATAVATEWLDDVGVSNQGGPAVQTSTSAPAWVNAFADVTVSRVASTGTSSACQSHDDDMPVHDDMVNRCICSCFIFVGSLFY